VLSTAQGFSLNEVENMAESHYRLLHVVDLSGIDRHLNRKSSGLIILRITINVKTNFTYEYQTNSGSDLEN
jgi:hypothetical protein